MITLVDRIGYIGKRRLQWLGHFERMNNDRLPIRALHIQEVKGQNFEEDKKDIHIFI